MKRIAVAVAVLAVLVGLSAVPVYAQEVPPLPHAFYGTVEINGNPAPVGTQVEARGEAVLTGIEGNPIVTTVPGEYGGAGPLAPKLIVQGFILEGATITFYVNGESTGQTAEWHSGKVTELDLSVTIAAPPAGGGVGVRDTTPPRISNVSLCLEGVTKTTADICWTTNEKSTSQVEYWITSSILSPLDETRVINHCVHLTDLTPGTTYYFKVMSRDAADNLAVSPDEYTFTTLGEAPAAAFASTKLSISPSEVNIGEEVTISVTVTNTGDLAGSYKVTLKIKGAVEATKEVTLNAGASREVTFTTAKDVAGSYSVAIDSLSGSFVVLPEEAPPEEVPPEEVPPPANWPLIGGIIAGVVIVGLLVFFLLRRRAA